jgi:hypothetical protein
VNDKKLRSQPYATEWEQRERRKELGRAPSYVDPNIQAANIEIKKCIS